MSSELLTCFDCYWVLAEAIVPYGGVTELTHSFLQEPETSNYFGDIFLMKTTFVKENINKNINNIFPIFFSFPILPQNMSQRLCNKKCAIDKILVLTFNYLCR